MTIDSTTQNSRTNQKRCSVILLDKEVPDEIIVDKAWNLRGKHGVIRIGQLIESAYGVSARDIGGSGCEKVRQVLRDHGVPVPDPVRRPNRKLKRKTKPPVECNPPKWFVRVHASSFAPRVITVSPDGINRVESVAT